MPMKDDMRELSNPYGPSDSFVHDDFSMLAFVSLPQFQINRRDAELWAVRDCKFLIFDDTDVKAQGSVTEDEVSMLEWSLRLVLSLACIGIWNQNDPRTPREEGTSEPVVPVLPIEIDNDSVQLNRNGAAGTEVTHGNEEAAVPERSGEPNGDNNIEACPGKDKGKEVDIEKRRDEGNENIPDDQERQSQTWKWAEKETDAALKLYWNHEPNYGPEPWSKSKRAETNKPEENSPDCAICSKLPEFPHDRKTRKFRLFRPRDAYPELFKGGVSAHNICAHYVAVSYCWPPKQYDEKGHQIISKNASQIRDLDGRVRSSRALDDILERAVDVANTFGLRMIWIDQECLPQPPEDSLPSHQKDKELGIQAMDIIYNRAFITAGLQDVKLANQSQLETIRHLILEANADKEPRGGLSSHGLRDIIDFLEQVKNDRWYTRAWVVQEAISAGANLALTFRRGPGVVFRPKARVPNRRRGLPMHSLELLPRELSSEVVCIMVHEFQHIVQTARLLLRQGDWNSTGRYWAPNLQNASARDTVSAAENLHPIFQGPSSAVLAVTGAGIFGPRPTVDAAGALTLLGTRECYRPEDRMAIMANMCGYEYRLNSRTVAEQCESLRVALLALSLINGDFSLLVPEVYSHSLFTSTKASDKRPWGDAPHPFGELLQGLRPGWIHPFDIAFHCLDHVAIREFDVARVHSRDDTFGHIRIPAHLWAVGPIPINMRPLQDRFQEKWAKINHLKTVFEPQTGESDDAFSSRKQAIDAHVQRGDTMRRIKIELCRNGSISKTSPIWDGLEHYAATDIFQLQLDADHVEATRKTRSLLAEIVFGVLQYLNECVDTDSRAKGVANSIWQSIKRDYAKAGEPNQDLPDEVGEHLFQHPAVKNSPFETMQLHRDRQGGYLETWLIDRIMTRGVLWVGNYVPETITPAPSKDRTWPSDVPGWDKLSGGDGEAHQQYWQRLAESFGVRSQASFSPRIRRDFALLSAHVLKADNFADYYELHTNQDEDGLARFDERSSVGNILGVAGRIRKELRGETEQYRAQNWVSVFDVDGPCTIATPYNPSWEAIPHPSLRSMSTCWVVNIFKAPGNKNHLTSQDSSSAGAGVAGQGEPQSTSFMRVLNKVRGMWRVQEVPPWENYTVMGGGLQWEDYIVENEGLKAWKESLSAAHTDADGTQTGMHGST